MGDTSRSRADGRPESRSRRRRSGPAPSSYEFDFRSTARNGAVRMRFDGNEVAQLTVVPQKPPKPDEVPLQRDHYKGVFDPLTAIMALGQMAQDSRDLCRRTLSIFDGKHRFDLALSHRRDVEIRPANSRGQAVAGQLCRIRYVPLAGHRDNGETRDMARNHRLEVILRPVPDAGIAVPHEIRIPTFGGDIVITSRQIEITTAQRQRIALVH
ncbi:MAG: DUF3108 domain-containing protein [Sphingomonadales bacterium]|nr:DUF3108 domain-containing protein [Sphingomonadales bacterium]